MEKEENIMSLEKYNEIFDFISETFNICKEDAEMKYFKWQNTKILNALNPDIVNSLDLFKKLGAYFEPEIITNKAVPPCDL